MRYILYRQRTLVHLLADQFLVGSAALQMAAQWYLQVRLLTLAVKASAALGQRISSRSLRLLTGQLELRLHQFNLKRSLPHKALVLVA